MRMADLVTAAILIVICALYYFLSFFLDTFFGKGRLIARVL